MHAIERPQKSRFSAARRTDKRHDPAIGHVEISVLHRLKRTVINVEVFDFELIADAGRRGGVLCFEHYAFPVIRIVS